MRFCLAEASEKPIGASANHDRKSPAPAIGPEPSSLIFVKKKLMSIKF